jgi:hypothetical protein
MADPADRPGGQHPDRQLACDLFLPGGAAARISSVGSISLAALKWPPRRRCRPDSYMAGGRRWVPIKAAAAFTACPALTPNALAKASDSAGKSGIWRLHVRRGNDSGGALPI